MQPASNAIDTMLRVVDTQPAVTIALPFEPHMGKKGGFERNLAKAVTKVRGQLLDRFPAEAAEAVLQQLQAQVLDINYCAFAKSIVLFAAETTGHTLYLQLPLHEQVSVDDSFHMENLLQAVPQQPQYLVLTLSATQADVFLGEAGTLTQLKHNEAVHFRPGHAAADFFAYIDLGLQHLLQHYPYPVFLMGDAGSTTAFLQTTQHTAHIAACIPTAASESKAATMLHDLLAPYLHNWAHVKQAVILQQVKEARTSGTAFYGIRQVLNAVARKKGKLLVVERSYTGSPATGAEVPFYIKNTIDFLIEKVLRTGGNVAFVEQGRLRGCDSIALL